MPRFCANLTMLWNELDFVDRFAAAAKAGFTGVEYLFPYDHDKAIEYATALGCKQLNCLAGIAPAGVAPEKLRETFVSNLRPGLDRLRVQATSHAPRLTPAWAGSSRTSSCQLSAISYQLSVISGQLRLRTVSSRQLMAEC